MTICVRNALPPSHIARTTVLNATGTTPIYLAHTTMHALLLQLCALHSCEGTNRLEIYNIPANTHPLQSPLSPYNYIANHTFTHLSLSLPPPLSPHTRCIYKMDHHCPYINNCVGYRNFKAFFLSIFYGMLGCLTGIILFTIRGNDLISNVMYFLVMRDSFIIFFFSIPSQAIRLILNYMLQQQDDYDDEYLLRHGSITIINLWYRLSRYAHSTTPQQTTLTRHNRCLVAGFVLTGIMFVRHLSHMLNNRTVLEAMFHDVKVSLSIDLSMCLSLIE